jgi:hypothetical protein
VIGVSLLEGKGVSIPVVVAVFLSTVSKDYRARPG